MSCSFSHCDFQTKILSITAFTTFIAIVHFLLLPSSPPPLFQLKLHDVPARTKSRCICNLRESYPHINHPPNLDAMCGISATRYTTCGCVKSFIPKSVIRCSYYSRRQRNICNGHLDEIQTVGHEGGMCGRHPRLGEQPSPEALMSAAQCVG